jgi:hypothetical protein
MLVEDEKRARPYCGQPSTFSNRPPSRHQWSYGTSLRCLALSEAVRSSLIRAAVVCLIELSLPATALAGLNVGVELGQLVSADGAAALMTAWRVATLVTDHVLRRPAPAAIAEMGSTGLSRD